MKIKNISEKLDGETNTIRFNQNVSNTFIFYFGCLGK